MIIIGKLSCCWEWLIKFAARMGVWRLMRLLYLIIRDNSFNSSVINVIIRAILSYCSTFWSAIETRENLSLGAWGTLLVTGNIYSDPLFFVQFFHFRAISFCDPVVQMNNYYIQSTFVQINYFEYLLWSQDNYHSLILVSYLFPLDFFKN